MHPSPIFLALTVLDVIVLWLLIRARANWRMLAPLILVVLALNFLTYQAAGTGQGYPVAGGPPKDGLLLSCDVIEPDGAQQRGAIYLWLVPFAKHGSANPLAYRPKDGEPRAYAVPYDRHLHRLCETAKKAHQQGIDIVLHAERGKGSKRVTPGRSIPKWAFRAYALPPPAPPVKQVPSDHP